MTTRILTALIGASLLLSSTTAIAGPDEDVRDESRADAAKKRSEGWPMNRCMVGVRYHDDMVISGKGSLETGDRLITINGQNVEGLRTEQVGKIYADIPAGATVPITVERTGQKLDIQVPCGNLADFQGGYLKALDFAGAKKWPECVNALAAFPDDPLYTQLRISCASVSRNAKNYPIQKWTDDLYTSTIKQADYAAGLQPEAADVLIKGRVLISPSVYDDLLQTVSKWDGGKTWQSQQPDFERMRRGAVEGVRDSLIDPQSAIIDMPYDFMWGTWRQPFGGSYTGYITCGTVNAKNRMGGYTGSSPFVAVMNPAGFALHVGMDDPANMYSQSVNFGCMEMQKRLKYVGNNSETADNPASSADATPSMAQELEKLAQLHASGALTDQEYAAAKSRILTNNK